MAHPPHKWHVTRQGIIGAEPDEAICTYCGAEVFLFSDGACILISAFAQVMLNPKPGLPPKLPPKCPTPITSPAISE